MPVCGYRAGYFELGSAQFRPKSGLKSKIAGRILTSFRDTFSAAGFGVTRLAIVGLQFRPILVVKLAWTDQKKVTNFTGLA